MAFPNIRELAESSLSISLEGAFGLPVELVDPDGVEYTGIEGQVLFNRVEVTPEGAEMLVREPVAVVRKSSLTRVPLDTDSPKWACRVPLTPSRTAPLVSHIVERPVEGGDSIGFIRLYLRRADQS
jgi:hypothetical protein